MDSSPEPSFDLVLLNELAEGAQKVFRNADTLYQEAKILGAAGALSRALFLHQISLEECAKIEAMGWWATSLLAGFPINQKKVVEGFASHSRKNRINAYMLKASGEEQAAKGRGDWKAALEAFNNLQAEFHQKSNDAKNASLYVDFKDGKFIGPVERITDAMLAEIAARNEAFLGEAYPKIRLLSKLTRAPEESRERIVAFEKVIKAAKDPNEAMVSVRTLMDELIEIERAKCAVKPEDD
jgi:AbiV family abortive infection protein